MRRARRSARAGAATWSVAPGRVAMECISRTHRELGLGRQQAGMVGRRPTFDCLIQRHRRDLGPRGVSALPTNTRAAISTGEAVKKWTTSMTPRRRAIRATSGEHWRPIPGWRSQARPRALPPIVRPCVRGLPTEDRQRFSWRCASHARSGSKDLHSYRWRGAHLPAAWTAVTSFSFRCPPVSLARVRDRLSAP